MKVSEVVEGLGETFTIFDDRTQDSGHVSYGVEAVDGRRRVVVVYDWFSGELLNSPGDLAPTPPPKPRRPSSRVEDLRPSSST